MQMLTYFHIFFKSIAVNYMNTVSHCKKSVVYLLVALISKLVSKGLCKYSKIPIILKVDRIDPHLRGSVQETWR